MIIIIPLHISLHDIGFLHQVALGNIDEVKKLVSQRSNLVNFRDYDRRSK